LGVWQPHGLVLPIRSVVDKTTSVSAAPRLAAAAAVLAAGADEPTGALAAAPLETG
jgi:hypothetical protein